MAETATAALVGIGLLGIGAQWLAWRVQLPAILFLLAAGLTAGPGVLGWIDPDALLGELLFPVVSLAVAVILFEGGLTLRLHEIRGLGGPVRPPAHRRCPADLGQHGRRRVVAHRPALGACHPLRRHHGGHRPYRHRTAPAQRPPHRAGGQRAALGGAS
ncbi:MAG: cation:proton antiporter [Arhodomonas sp.]|nr:cation:proton antiporter [Arhodomonas sp.]